MNEPQERRRRSITDEDVSALLVAFEASHCISSSEHKSHHDFVRLLIEQNKVKAERAEKIKAQVYGWGIVTFLGGIGTAAYHAWQFLKDHWK